jgi:transposase
MPSAAYAVACRGVFNREMEKAFGVSMSTVYKRAAAVRREIWWAWPTHADAGCGDGLPPHGS